MTPHRIAVVLLVSIAACGGTSGETSGSGGSTAASGESAESSTSTTGSGGGYQTYTLEMDPFVVEPHEEVFKCQNFKNPFGEDVDVVRFESHMTAGSHHLLLFHGDEYAEAPLVDCSGLEFAPTLYGAQKADNEVRFPEGVAALLEASNGFRINSHYFNTTGQAITAQVRITLEIAAPGTVEHHAGVLWALNPNIYVMPNSEQVVSESCSIPFDMNVIQAVSHMHSHATHFEASVGGQMLYETDSWAEPEPAFFDPARPLAGGDTLTYACSYVNNTSQPLIFGESAGNNEMCIMTAAFYPVPEGATTVTCD